MEISKIKVFDNHKMVLFFNDNKLKLRGFISIHAIINNLSLGATRFSEYKSEEDALNDALRLSRAMTYKCAVSDISYGGAKAVIIRKPDSTKNLEFLKKYAFFVNSLGGIFRTGADVGILKEDIKILKRYSNYIIDDYKINDPSYWTAVGIFNAIKAGLNFVFNNLSLKNKLFAIKGIGKVGFNLLKIILENKCNVIISDKNKKVTEEVKKKFPSVKVVSENEIHKQKVDVYCPCALGGEFNEKKVRELNCKIICGGANNQLENEEIGNLIFKRGIVYVPDYLANSGGLISVVCTYENKSREFLIKKIEKIYNKTKELLEWSFKNNIPTNIVLDKKMFDLINKKI